MRRVFADTLYWIALVNPQDQWREAAREAERQEAGSLLVTTEEILNEVLTALAGSYRRVQAASMVTAIMAGPNVTILPQSHESFVKGLAFYVSRPDKGYSMTDCISMNACRAEGITEVLTNDHHFTQEGFTILI